MSRPQFTEKAWEEYLYWQSQDKKILIKINKLIADIMRNGPMEGEGKPEALRDNLNGYYSRRINEKDRLVYAVLQDEIVEIYSCRDHYQK